MQTLIKTIARDGPKNYVNIFKGTNLSESEILDGILNLDSFASTLKEKKKN